MIQIEIMSLRSANNWLRAYVMGSRHKTLESSANIFLRLVDWMVCFSTHCSILYVNVTSTRECLEEFTLDGLYLRLSQVLTTFKCSCSTPRTAIQIILNWITKVALNNWLSNLCNRVLLLFLFSRREASSLWRGKYDRKDSKARYRDKPFSYVYLLYCRLCFYGHEKRIAQGGKDFLLLREIKTPNNEDAK